MTTGYETFQLWQSLKLHFTTDSYDFFKYRGKLRETKKSIESFKSRSDRAILELLGIKHSREELTKIFVAYFVSFLWPNKYTHSSTKWVGDIYLNNNVKQIYLDWQKRIDFIKDYFADQCHLIFTQNTKKFKDIIDNDNPLLWRLLTSEELAPETLILLDKFLNLFTNWDNGCLKNDFLWQENRLILIKYRPFFVVSDINVYRNIFDKEFNEWLKHR